MEQLENIDMTGPGSVPAISLKTLGEILVRHFNLHEGRWEVSVSFQVGFGGVGPPDKLSPGVILGLQGIGLSRITHETANAVDAAELNPRGEMQAKVQDSQPAAPPAKPRKVAPAKR
jgi:hypothetical protein